MISPDQVKRMRFYQEFISNASKLDDIIQISHKSGASLGMGINNEGKIFNTLIKNLKDLKEESPIKQGAQTFQTFITKGYFTHTNVFNIFGKVGKILNVLKLDGTFSNISSQQKKTLTLHIIHSKQAQIDYISSQISKPFQINNKSVKQIIFSQQLIAQLEKIAKDKRPLKRKKKRKNHNQYQQQKQQKLDCYQKRMSEDTSSDSQDQTNNLISFYQKFGTHVIMRIKKCNSFYGSIKMSATNKSKLKYFSADAQMNALQSVASQLTRAFGSLNIQAKIQNMTKKEKMDISCQCNLKTYGVDAPIGGGGSLRNLLRAYILYMNFIYMDEKNPLLREKLKKLLQILWSENQAKQEQDTQKIQKFKSLLQKQNEMNKLIYNMRLIPLSKNENAKTDKQDKNSVLQDKLTKLQNSIKDLTKLTTQFQNLNQESFLKNTTIQSLKDSLSSNNSLTEQQKKKIINEIVQKVQEKMFQKNDQKRSSAPYLMVCYPWPFLFPEMRQKSNNQITQKPYLTQQHILKLLKIVQQRRDIQRQHIQDKICEFVKNQMLLSNYQIAANIILLSPKLERFEKKVIKYFFNNGQFMRLTKLWLAMQKNPNKIARDFAEDNLHKFRKLNICTKLWISLTYCFQKDYKRYQLCCYNYEQQKQKLKQYNQEKHEQKNNKVQEIYTQRSMKNKK